MKASRKVSDHPIIALTGPEGGFPNRAIEGSPIWHPLRKRFEMTFSGLNAGRSGPPFWRVYGAHSPDGVSWTLAKGGSPLIPTSEGEWDFREQGRSCQYFEDGVTWLLYNGSDDMPNAYVPGTLRIGLASSTDGICWQKHGVVLQGTVPRHTRYSCWVTRQGNTYVMLYNDNRFEFHISRATAPALQGPWTPDSRNPVITGEGTPWANKAEDCSVVCRDGEYLIFVDDLGYSQGTPYGIPLYRTRDIIEGPIEFVELFIPQPDTRGRFRGTAARSARPARAWLPTGRCCCYTAAHKTGTAPASGPCSSTPERSMGGTMDAGVHCMGNGRLTVYARGPEIYSVSALPAARARQSA